MRLLRGKGKGDSFWCDALIEDANVARVRSEDIAAPPKIVYRWLCQLRVSAYSYGWADSGVYRSPRELMPGLDRLQLGQTMMGVYELAHLVPGRELTVRLDRGRMAERGLERWHAPAATTYLLTGGATSSRLVAKSVTAFPGGFRWRMVRWIVRPVDRLVLKRQLRTLKRMAERDWAKERERPVASEDVPLAVVALPARKRESVAN
jgi:hypothetical protein